MIPIPVRLALSAALSVLAVILYSVTRGKTRLAAMKAMLLSSVGDVFMVNSDAWGQFAVFIGAAFFIAAHIIYGAGFRERVISSGKAAVNKGTFTGVAFMALSAAVLGYFALFVSRDPKPVMFVMVLLYIAAIGFNVSECFTCAFAFGKTGVLLPVAAVVFYISDIFIFCNMLNITPALRPYVWFLYPEAQLMLILFCERLKIKK